MAVKKRKSKVRKLTPKSKIKKNTKPKWDYESPKYVEWRSSVFKRDGYTCRICGKCGGYIEAHHIKKKSEYPSLAFSIGNGITLCKLHHFIITTRETFFAVLCYSIVKKARKDYNVIKNEFNICLTMST
jgi:hypothetical protein